MPPRIIIVGLGPGNPAQVTVEARLLLTGGFPVYFRTLKHPSAQYFAPAIKIRKSFDRLYDDNPDFGQVYRDIVGYLLNAAQKHQTIVYAVPGHPSVGEMTVEKLRRFGNRLGVKIDIVAGLSFLEPLLSRLKVDLLDGVTVFDALAISSMNEPCRNHLIIAQVYSRSIASKVKLKLLELYPADFPVTLVGAAGMPKQVYKKIPLRSLDHLDLFDHLTTIYLPPFSQAGPGDLIKIMARLRAPDGCPWDRKQTHKSLRQYLIEEAYEVVAAIDSGSDTKLVEELGDLLLQVVFHSQIAREESRFDFFSVTEAITTKLIRRHPHVFGTEHAESADDVKLLWEQIKADERNETKHHAAVSVDHSLPALLKAYKLQKKASELGFDWPSLKGPLEKAREELAELEEACTANDRQSIEEEFGDYLFTVVNIARFLKVNPELALGKTISKFIERFGYVLEQVENSGRSVENFSLQELDNWWDEAKKIRKISKLSRNPQKKRE
jgi:tetrapyrrole methylase family protein / MazG family protein